MYMDLIKLLNASDGWFGYPTGVEELQFERCERSHWKARVPNGSSVQFSSRAVLWLRVYGYNDKGLS